MSATRAALPAAVTKSVAGPNPFDSYSFDISTIVNPSGKVIRCVYTAPRAI